MPKTITRQYIQDAPDFDYQLKQSDNGRLVTVHNGKFIVSDFPKIEIPQSYYIGAQLRIQSALDGPGELNSSSQGKTITWDDITKKFVMSSLQGSDAATLQGHPASYFAVSTHVHAGEDITSGTVADARIASTITRDSEVMSIVFAADGAGSTLDADLLDGLDSLAYVKADGSVTGATGAIQPFTLGMKSPFWRPIANGLTNQKIQNVDGSTDIFIIDTTNNIVGVGATDTANPSQFNVQTASGACISNVRGASGQAVIAAETYQNSTTGSAYQMLSARGTFASPAVSQSGDRVGVFIAYGYSGAAANFKECAAIEFFIDGTPDTAGDTTDMPGRIHFATSPDGTATRTERIRITNAGLVGIGATTSTAAHLHVQGSISLSAWGVNGILSQMAASTFTDTSTAQNATVTTAVFNSFGRPTLAATNTGITYTNAATVYIANSPLGSGTTITNAYALWVAAGSVRLDGNIGFFSTAPAARVSAYTQTYATATRTFSAYTTNDQSAAYTGQDNVQIGSVYAKVVDLNTLRTAYENLRAASDIQGKLINSIIDDMQTYGLFQ